jgi:hypothetical protein
MQLQQLLSQCGIYTLELPTCWDAWNSTRQVTNNTMADMQNQPSQHTNIYACAAKLAQLLLLHQQPKARALLIDPGLQGGGPLSQALCDIQTGTTQQATVSAGCGGHLGKAEVSMHSAVPVSLVKCSHIQGSTPVVCDAALHAKPAFCAGELYCVPPDARHRQP